MQEELGIKHFNGKYDILGVDDHLYETCFYKKDPNITSTHYVVIGIKIQLGCQDIDCSKIMDQHSCYKWVDRQSLLSDETIHQNTKNYFIEMNNYHINY